MTQRRFTKELRDEFEDKDLTPVVCPLDCNIKLAVDQGEFFDNPGLYRKIVSKLNFVTHTRRDLAFAIQHISQFMQAPKEPHFQAAMHVLRYLKG